MEKITILGAGIAGLSCAYELARRKIPCEIIEGLPEVGGLSRNFHYKDFTFDIGPHRVYSEYPDTLAFIQELCGQLPEHVQRKSRMRLKGRYYDYPFNAKELIRNLPPGLALKFIASYGWTLLSSGSKDLDESSYEGYLRKRFGKAIGDFFFIPYAHKVWGIPPAEISSDIVKVRLSQKNLYSTVKDLLSPPKNEKNKSYVSDFIYPKKGIGVIPNELARKVMELGVPIHLNTRITDLVLDKTLYGTFVQSLCCETPEGNRTIPVSSIVSTLPLAKLIPWTQPADPELVEISRHLKHRNVILGCIMLRKPQVTGDHWLYYPEEEFHFTRIHQPKNFSPELCPPNKSSLVVEMTCFQDDTRWRSTDLELYEIISNDLLATGLVQITDIEDYAIYRIPHAYPIYEKDYKSRLAKLFGYLGTVHNLISTGRQGLYHHNNIDHSIRMGQDAARHCNQHPQSSLPWYESISAYDRFRIID